jgi:hypothetical protein
VGENFKALPAGLALTNSFKGSGVVTAAAGKLQNK